ncbi:carbonic anhydrase [Coprinopsis marcescibilis]|uniref:carbonic anhydrase n=1 Tax=Coprinopsis marcescibilis TaxID=230819 RepID=A0A5C3LMV1_COPMA|nr:carbonic anhydrase [Coprinopsis marcescibilis]
MPLRYWLRCASPRTTSVCIYTTTRASRRPNLSHKRHVSSTSPTASALAVPQLSSLPSLKQAWSSLFPHSTASCGCPNHSKPQETESQTQATYALHRERLHRALVDHFHEIEQLYRGNVEYVRSMGEHSPGLLEDLAFEGQRPPFMLLDCSDSRVNEQSIFNAQPGTMFTSGNIANMFDEKDTNSNAVLAYAVDSLGVKHVVVLGHYGCGGVAASMSPLPPGWHAYVKGTTALPSSALPDVTPSAEIDGLETQPAQSEGLTCPQPSASELAVQKWIQPIRDIYETSIRWEIRAHRERAIRQRKNGTPPPTKPLHLHDPAFRALVEENVKENVKRVLESKVIKDHYNALPHSPPPPTPAVAGASHSPLPPHNPVYIHGWVYDLETGVVSDLGVSVGPPGWSTPRTYSAS